MRAFTRFLSLGTLLFFASIASAQTSGWVTLTASNIQSATGGKLATGTLCLQPVDTSNHPLAVTAGGTSGGVVLSSPACVTVTNGAISATQVIDTALSSPQNACLRLTVTNTTGISQLPSSGFSCLQPSSNDAAGTEAYTWCTTTSGVTTCNLDKFQPTAAAQAVVTTGPPGPQGASSITGLSGDGAGNATLAGTFTANSALLAQFRGVLDATRFGGGGCLWPD